MGLKSKMINKLYILGDVDSLSGSDDNYVIPRYQRAYAWEEKEIEQLLDDIYFRDSTNDYYLGSLIVSKKEVGDNQNDTYEVIDGQQRLTTLFLLIQYLKEKPVKNINLSFDCREKSNKTLKAIGNNIDNVDIELETSILDGLKIIEQWFSRQEAKIADFVNRLERVILFRIEVPENTDLNRYFEIMNTRGVQLEQTDILKARLMADLGKEEQDLFSTIWDACSDMTGYVQMHFLDVEAREKVFGDHWDAFPKVVWKTQTEPVNTNNGTNEPPTITDIIYSTMEVDKKDGLSNEDTKVRFESIIDFPYFLLHALRVYQNFPNVISLSDSNQQLDDKKLLEAFEKHIEGETKDMSRFAKDFASLLLQLRFLFDKFIIKREFTNDDIEGEWSLKELHVSGQGTNKKAYYSNTVLKHKNERYKTWEPRNKECLMIQSALRVSYTSPKAMHWITILLAWAFRNKDNVSKLTLEAETIAAQSVNDNFLKIEAYACGVNTPHLVFNFLDYLLWKENKDKYKDFVFEYRNSVEHWYPQHPSSGTFQTWEDKDTFGNLCIISRSVNSKFSNLSPESKMKTFGDMVKRGSIKLRIMGELCNKNGANKEWRNSQCKIHEDEMVKKLEEAAEDYRHGK